MNSQTMLEKTITKIEGAYAKSTIRAYRADFGEFINFCELISTEALPASNNAVSRYIDYLIDKGLSSASIRRAVAAIASIHVLNRCENPTLAPEVKIEMKRMHRKIGRHSAQAEAITRDVMNEMLNVINDNSIRSLRDKTLLLVAYETMCRRSELVDIEICDISKRIIDRKTGTYSTVILIRKSKTDQEAHGRWILLSKQTSDILDNWLNEANIKSGKVFRGITKGHQVTNQLTSGHISRIYKKIAASARFDDNFVRHISGHSTRVGAAQDLLISGASLPMIMSKGRWSKSDTVMRYVEKVSILI